MILTGIETTFWVAYNVTMLASLRGKLEVVFLSKFNLWNFSYKLIDVCCRWQQWESIKFYKNRTDLCFDVRQIVRTSRRSASFLSRLTCRNLKTMIRYNRYRNIINFKKWFSYDREAVKESNTSDEHRSIYTCNFSTNPSAKLNLSRKICIYYVLCNTLV